MWRIIIYSSKIDIVWLKEWANKLVLEDIICREVFKPCKPTYFKTQWETRPIIYPPMDHNQESSSPDTWLRLSMPRVHRILVCFVLLSQNIRDWVTCNMQKLTGSQFWSIEGPRSRCQHLKRPFCCVITGWQIRPWEKTGRAWTHLC